MARLKKLAVAHIKNTGASVVVHCRSYLPALVGLYLQKKFKARFIFDMRGFWADERIEGGIWKLKNPLHKSAYRYFKRKEKELIAKADHIITLSNKSREIILSWKLCKSARISTIPCCVDLEYFDVKTAEQKFEFRKELGIGKNIFVMGYLGSLGTWYMLNEMLDFFAVQLQSDPKAVFAFITPDSPELIRSAATKRGIPLGNIFIRASKRSEVPAYISLFNVGLFLIRPTFSKQASSPTKMAEILACGVPVITNTGIGDCDAIIRETTCGTLVEEFSPADYKNALNQMKFIHNEAGYLRGISEKYFSLNDGILSYANIYRQLSGSNKA
jgi:glycosyltransferase involved in cell wall biosynthesis